MQPFVLLWVGLCLVVDSSTKYINSTEDETGIGDLTIRSYWNADDNPTAEECKCENGFCEKNDNGKLVCKCPPEWGLWTSTICRECDCGKDSNCTFSLLTKTCICKDGYKEVNGFCIEECKCENGFCEKNDKGKLVCKCPPEWGLLVPTICIQCDCGKDSNCTFGFVSKTCICKDRYKEVNGFCRELCPLDKNVKECREKKKLCIVDENVPGGFKCICNEGEIEDENGNCIDMCSPNPCKNGGTCKATKGVVTCHCKDGFGDIDCSTELCFPNPCKNGGTCIATRGEATCQCKDGFGGADCSINVCSPNPCKNGGICNATRGEVACECKDGFRGADCSIDVCSPNPCKNGGTCNTTGKEATCLCKDGFGGAVCSIDVCSPNPCKNGGTCNAMRGEATCQCKDRFKGADCSMDVCSPNPCRNNGVCNVTEKGVICQCRDRFRGADCSIEIPMIVTSTSVEIMNRTQNWTTQPTTSNDPCTESPCQNGGTCITVGNTRKCLCKKPYLGILCETDPCNWNPCKNGGVCKIEYETVRCFCREPFTGEFCESRTRIDMHVITLVAGSVILTAILTFVTCMLCQRYHVLRARSENC